MTAVQRKSLLLVALGVAAACDKGPVQPRVAPQETPLQAETISPTVSIFPGALDYYSGIVSPGSCRDFSATVYDEFGNLLTNPVVTWTLGDGRVAYFSNNNAASWTGQGTAHVCGQGSGYGYTDLTARWTSQNSPYPSATDARPIEYGQTLDGYQPQSLNVEPASQDLYPGQQQGLTATGVDQFAHTRQVNEDYVDWSSSNSAVATVNANGVVTAVAKGSATITGNVHGTPGTAVITVLGLESLIVTPNPATVCLNGGTVVTAEARDQKNNIWPLGVVSWSSSDPATATVSWYQSQNDPGHRKGGVGGAAEGQANAIATLDGTPASSSVTVVYCTPVAGVSGPYTLNLYQYGRFTASQYNGAPPFTYEFRRKDCPVSEFECQPYGIWYSTGTTNYWDTIVYSCGIQHFYIEARVTDSRGGASISAPWKTYINNPC